MVPNEMKQLESLGKFRNAIKLWGPTSCLADYAKDIFLGLGFFNKILLRNDHAFFFFFVCLFYFISLCEVTFQLLFKFSSLSLLAFSFYEKRYFLWYSFNCIFLFPILNKQ